MSVFDLAGRWSLANGRIGQVVMRSWSIVFLVIVASWLVGEQTMAVLANPQVTAEVADGLPESRADAVIYTTYMPVVGTPPLEPPYDMTTFLVGDGRLYEVWHSSDTQARHQTQVEGTRFFHTKGNEVSAEWEELWATDEFIYRGVDTSPGNGLYYIAYDRLDQVGAIWSPRVWDVGDLFERNTYVSFHDKGTCSQVAQGFQRSWLRFVAFYPTYTFDSGITLSNVIELAWVLAPTAEPTESYFYAQNYGLVGWASDDRGFSYISEIHGPGQRPDNQREVIDCLNQSFRITPLEWDSPIGPLPPGYRAK